MGVSLSGSTAECAWREKRLFRAHLGRSSFGTRFSFDACWPPGGCDSAVLMAARRASGGGGSRGWPRRVGAGSSPGTPPRSTAALAASPAEAARQDTRL